MVSQTYMIQKSSNIPDCLQVETKARIINECYKYLKLSMKTPTFFIIPNIPGDNSTELLYQRIRSSLSGFQHQGKNVPLVELTFTPRDLGLSDEPLLRNLVVFRCLAVDVRAIERVKDRIKMALWQPLGRASSDISQERIDQNVIKHLLQDFIEILAHPSSKHQRLEGPRGRTLSLESHGMFYPKQSQESKRIKTHSFDHGGGHFYRYRVCQEKLWECERMPGVLRDYLFSLFEDCPNHFFKEGPRISAIDWPIWPLSTRSLQDPLSNLATRALQKPRFKGAHDNVEMYALEHDRSSIATEIPVWLEPGEIGRFAELFDNLKPLSGHIDLLRYSKGKIEIWDYKPNAKQNPESGSQVLIYAIAISIRLNLSLKKFRCGYFDTEDTFRFDPVKTQFVRPESPGSPIKKAVK